MTSARPRAKTGANHRNGSHAKTVLPDQLVDRTTGRDHTSYDDGAVHVTFADPYCPALREAVSTATATAGQALHDGGTVVVIDGPRGWWS